MGVEASVDLYKWPKLPTWRKQANEHPWYCTSRAALQVICRDDASSLAPQPTCCFVCCFVGSWLSYGGLLSAAYFMATVCYSLAFVAVDYFHFTEGKMNYGQINFSLQSQH